MRFLIIGIFVVLVMGSPLVQASDEAPEASKGSEEVTQETEKLTKKELKAKRRAEKKAARDKRRAANDSTIRCTRGVRTGSHFRNTRCASNAQRREEREAARKMLEEGQGGPIGSPGDSL